MSEVKIVVEASAGEQVGTVASTAFEWANYAIEGGVFANVTFIHNDIEVSVLPGDTVGMLCDRWDERRRSKGTGWIDPPNVHHVCYDEEPKNLTRADYRRRWRCSCGKLYIVNESQRDGYYFEPVTEESSK